MLKIIEKSPGINRRDIALTANLKNPYDICVYQYHLDSLLKTGMVYKYNTIQYQITNLGKQALIQAGETIKNVALGR
jgi:predicted transcriptional regulator